MNNPFIQNFRGIHPSQYPPLYPHPGLPGALERERLGLPPGPQHMDPNEQMVSFLPY
jgi:arginine-glutamic acid dipeptide repeats protein